MSATLRRIARNERAYPWERTPLESVGWALRPRYRLAHAASFYSNVMTALDRALYPGFDVMSDRRELVKSHVDTALEYLRMAVEK